jgi:hypothetical protein
MHSLNSVLAEDMNQANANFYDEQEQLARKQLFDEVMENLNEGSNMMFGADLNLSQNTYNYISQIYVQNSVVGLEPNILEYPRPDVKRGVDGSVGAGLTNNDMDWLDLCYVILVRLTETSSVGKAAIIINIIIAEKCQVDIPSEDIFAYHVMGWVPDRTPEPTEPDPPPVEVDSSVKSTDIDCPICMSELTDDVWKCPHCNREVCYECMQQWLHTPCDYIPAIVEREYMGITRGHDICPSCQITLR